MKLISRPQYYEQIKPFIGKGLIKIITGQRRVGKSYLLLHLIEEFKQQNIDPTNIIYINKELNDFDHIDNQESLKAYIEGKLVDADRRRPIKLLIDEVQEIADFEKVVRHYALQSNFDVYLTGSNASIISGDLATLLSGRYVEIKVYPLTFPEFLKFSRLSANTNSLERYLKYGGLPYIHQLDLADQPVQTYLENIYNTILLKDIVKRFEIRNVHFLEALVKFLAGNLGSVFSANSVSKYLKEQKSSLSPVIIHNYIKGLQQAYLIDESRRYDLIGKKLLKLGVKLYFNDLGLRNYVNGFGKFNVPATMENAVFSHLVAHGYKVYTAEVGVNEVDFIAEKGGEKKYYQVAYLLTDKVTQEREFANLVKIQDNFPKSVISMDPVTIKYEGIDHINLLDFLLQSV